VTTAVHPSRLPVNRRGLAVAGALVLLSLGLPWQQITAVPGVLIPGVIVPDPLGGDLGSGVAYLPGVFVPSTGGGTILGTGHAMRATSLVAALLLCWAIRHGSRRSAWLAIAIGALALPLGVNQGAVMTGRVAYLAALLTAAAAIGLLSIPRPRRTRNSGHAPAHPTPSPPT
jgi:hypothetical protein